MKAWVSSIAAVLFLASFAPLASAQDGMPTAGLTQVHGEKWDWGYVGVAPIFGFSLGDRFDLTAAGFSEFGTDPILGTKMFFGFGSNSDRIGNEFYGTFLRYKYSGTLALTAEEYSTEQWFAKFGFNLLYEVMSNEVLTDEGQILKEDSLGLTLFGGLYWLTFFGNDFDLIPSDPTNDTEVTDNTIWIKLGVLVEYPLSDIFSVTGHASIDFYLFHFGDPDDGDINFRTFTEEMQFTIGAMAQFHPFLQTDGGNHWRFYLGANLVLIQNPQPNQLIFSGGVNFGW